MAHQGKNYPITITEDTPDDFSNESFGHSWLDHSLFTDPEEGDNPLFKDLIRAGYGHLTQDGKFLPNISEMLSWLIYSGETLRLLQLLHYCVPHPSGQLLEGLDAKLRNGWKGRNVFMHCGQLVFITHQMKQDGRQAQNAYLPYFLPDAIQEVTWIYMILHCAHHLRLK